MAASFPKESSAFELTFRPQTVWSSYVATAYKPDGTSLGTMATSAGAVDTTVASAADRNTFTLTSASGVTPGRSYLLTDSEVGTAEVVEVDSVNGSVVSTVETLTQAPSAGSTFKELEVRVRLTADATPDYDTHYYVVLANSSTAEEMRVYYHVVRQVFERPMTAQALRKIIVAGWGGSPMLARPQELRDAVERINDEVEGHLLDSGQFPHLVGDPFALQRAGREAAYFVLAHVYGMFPRSAESKDIFLDRQERRVAQAIGSAITTLSGKDGDDDGEVDEPDTDGHVLILLSA